MGYTAKRTLGILQVLYEKYKVLTYPRTDSRYLPEGMLGAVQSLIVSLQQGELGSFAKRALEQNYVRFDKRIFNDKKVSDHHALIPTPHLPKQLPEAEAKLYKMVVQRLLAVLYPAARYDLALRISSVGEERFKTEGKVLKEAGWKVIYGTTEDDNHIEPLPAGSVVMMEKGELIEEVTQPPGRFNEASLLLLMESAGKFVENEELRDAMKDRGLGTPATRAQTIEKLIMDKYILREDKVLVPTTKALELMRLLEAMSIKNLRSPELTGEWEYKLSLIERKELTREDFMRGITQEAIKMIGAIRSFKEDSTRQEASFSPVMVDGREVRFYETIMRYYSEDGVIVIRKMMGGGDFLWGKRYRSY